MFTYQGFRFQIADVMGTFRMTKKNKIHKFGFNKKGRIFYKDLSGHLCNEKGYLVNSNGDIVTRKGKVLFHYRSLKNGEFPKIFEFSQFSP